MNFNFHQSLDDKVQRLINCMEPGTKVEIHHHPVDEMLIVIRGAIKAILVDDDKNIIDAKVIRPADGVYGVQLLKNVWHTIECLEPDTCVFEVKEGPFVSHKEGGILEWKDKQAKGAMLEKYGSLELRISGTWEELREFWISGIQEVGIVKRNAGKRRDAEDQDRCLW